MLDSHGHAPALKDALLGSALEARASTATQGRLIRLTLGLGRLEAATLQLDWRRDSLADVQATIDAELRRGLTGTMVSTCPNER